MRVVVADTSPLGYLLQIDQIELLPRLFEILIPSVVCDELKHPSAPEVMRNWMNLRHGWLEVSVVSAGEDPSLAALDEGEKPAMRLGCLSGPASSSLMSAEARQLRATGGSKSPGLWAFSTSLHAAA